MQDYTFTRVCKHSMYVKNTVNKELATLIQDLRTLGLTETINVFLKEFIITVCTVHFFKKVSWTTLIS